MLDFIGAMVMTAVLLGLLIICFYVVVVVINGILDLFDDKWGK